MMCVKMRTASLLHAVFLTLAVSAVSADGTNGRDLTFTAKMLPGCDLHTNVASRAGWLWNSDEKVKDGGVSYFRKAFELTDEVVAAKLRIKVDDGGTLWVNGRTVPFSGVDADAAALKAALVKGPNVIAVKVVNGGASAGAIFRGQFDLRDGTRVSIVSDRTVKAAAKADEGWQQVGFDDSAWKGPVWIGDAMCWPWSELAPMEKFLSVAEKAAWDRDDEAGRCRLPPGLADEPEMDAKVVWKDGVAWISLNGELHMPEFNLVGAKYPWTASQLLRFRDIGIHFHNVQFESGAFWRDDGKYDFSCFDREARRILQLDPAARLILSMRLSMTEWCAKHPDEAMKYLAGDGSGDEASGCPVRASCASRELRREFGTMFRAFGDYVRAQPWGKRVFAVRPHWGIYTEWHVYGMFSGPDVSRPMTDAFHRYLGGKYANEAPPTMAERTTNGGWVLDPVRNAKAIDYFRMMADEVADLLIFCAQELKRDFPGRLVGAYYGYVLTGQPPEGSNVLLDKVLASPDIDFLNGPPEYIPYIRLAGGAFHHRLIPEMFRIRGKLCLLEDDTRYHNVREWLDVFYGLRTPEESVAVMYRNYLSRLFDGGGVQYIDPHGKKTRRPAMYDDSLVLGTCRDARRVFREALPVAERSGNEVAYVAKLADRLRTDTGTKAGRDRLREIYNQNTAALYASGVPFDVLEYGDWQVRKNDYRESIVIDLDCPVVKTAKEWAAHFDARGVHRYAAPGALVRRRGDLILFHVANAGVHELTLPTAERQCQVRELISGRVLDAQSIRVESSGPATWLFRVTKR